MKIRPTTLWLSPFLIIALLAMLNGRLLFAISPNTADPIEITSAVDPDTVNPSGIIPGQMIRFFLTVKNVTNETYQNVQAHTTVPTFTTFNLGESDSRWTLRDSTTASDTASDTAADSTLAVCPDGAGAGSDCVLSLGSLAAGQEVIISYAVNLDSFLPPDFTQLSFTYGATWDPNVTITILPPTIVVVTSAPTPTGAAPVPTSTAAPAPTQTATALPEIRAYLPLMLR